MAFSGVAEKAYFSVQIVSGNAKSVKLFDSGIEVTSGQDLSFGSHELTLVVEDLSGHTTSPQFSLLDLRLWRLSSLCSYLL